MTQINFTLANSGNAHAPLDNLTPVPVRTHVKTLMTGSPVIVIDDGTRQFSMRLSSAQRLAESIMETVEQVQSV